MVGKLVQPETLREMATRLGRNETLMVYDLTDISNPPLMLDLDDYFSGELHHTVEETMDMRVMWSDYQPDAYGYIRVCVQ